MRFDSVMLRLEKYANRCTKSESDILNVILSNPQFVVKQTIVDVAAKCGVSEPTITRFVKKLNFQNYTEFRLMLSQELLRDELKRNKPDENEGEIAGMFKEYKMLLEKASALISKEDLDELIAVMDQSKRIKIYGVGASGLTAHEAATKLLRVGYDVYPVSDVSYMRRDASYCRSGDMVIALSVSGETRDLILAMEFAHKQGAYVVLISAYEQSKASVYADKVILTAQKDSLSMGHFISPEIAQLFVFDCLYVRLVRRNPDKVIEYETKALTAVLDNVVENPRNKRTRKKPG